MSYAVLQKNLEPPSLDQLKNAFQNVPGLTALDAFGVGKDAFGILVKGFDLDSASRLQSALAAQGVETELVDEAALPPLPEIRNVHRVDCTPDALMIYDALGRNFPLKWVDVMMIAAGSVRLIDFNTVEVRRPVAHHGRGGDSPVTLEIKEQPADHWILEIIVSGAALRYSIVADHAECLLFQYLDSRRTRELAGNFKLLVQDLTKAAPQATVNHGAFYLRENSPTPFHYPSKNAFYEEIVWLLWQNISKRPSE